MLHGTAKMAANASLDIHVSQSVFFSLWSMTSGGTLLIHIIAVKFLSLARNRNREHGNGVMQ